MSSVGRRCVTQDGACYNIAVSAGTKAKSDHGKESSSLNSLSLLEVVFMVN